MKHCVLLSFVAACAATDARPVSRAVDMCAAVGDGTNVGCALGETASGGTNTGPVYCNNGVSEVLACGPVAACVVEPDGTGHCQAYACDPATTPTYCTADNNFVACDAETGSYGDLGCGGDSRCDPQRGCIEVKGTPCDPITFQPFCGEGAGQPSLTACDPKTNTVVVRTCNEGAACTTALGQAACLTPPPTGATMPYVDIALCVGGNIGILVPNENPPSTGTWKTQPCPAGTTCDWNPTTGQAWCRSTGIVDQQIALFAE